MAEAAGDGVWMAEAMMTDAEEEVWQWQVGEELWPWIMVGEWLILAMTEEVAMTEEAEEKLRL